MVKLIVGLGNPGGEYARTRHNVGFWCVEEIMRLQSVAKDKQKWQARVADVVIHGHKVYLVRPQTFMNLSGRAVREAVDFLKVQDLQHEMLVIYDDMDLPVGSIRLREKGSAGGHNGMKSIMEHLGITEFPRIRIGIGRPSTDVIVTDHVLSAFAKSERPEVEDAVQRAAQAAVATCETPFAIVMNAFNSRS